jgi:hypothetical protein
MKLQDIVHQRLSNQLISHSQFSDPTEVVRWMGAMQAQDYNASLWAIGMRIRKSMEVRDTIIAQAVAERRIVRTWPMRGTLHWVAPRDARWMLRLLTPRVIKGSAGRYRELELDEAVFVKSRIIIEKALEGNKRLTRPELYDFLEQEGIRTHDQRGIHILGHLAMAGIICMGVKEGNQPTFVLLDEWLPAYPIPEGDEALAILTSRYFTSHGPATVYDFATWAGLQVSDARKGLELVSPAFEQVLVDGQRYWLSLSSKEANQSKEEGKVWLLPAFDEMLCGYRDRSAILDSADVKAAILKNGIIRPILVMGDRAVGAWKRTMKKDQVLVEFSFFRDLSERDKKIFEEKAGDFGEFLEKEVIFG